jgi:hypothetical protein
MRRFGLMVALVTIAAAAGTAALAAELDIPPRPAPANVSMQQGPPNCSRWTDDCVNCARSTEGEAPLCSNIGVACQPKAIRCLSPAVPVK